MSIDEKALRAVYEKYTGRDLAWNDFSDIIVTHENAKDEQHKGVCKFCGRKCGCYSPEQPVDSSIISHPQWPLVAKGQWEAEQVLGKALGYPWYKDDKKNFPDATESDGVCTGDHTLVTIAMEAASKIVRESIVIPDSAWQDRNKWQPIATAPKDGSLILLLDEPDEIICVGGWKEKSTNTNDHCWRVSWDHDEFEATHWMPAPNIQIEGGSQ